MARVNVTPYFENTTMQVYYNSNNVLTAYYIYPCEGYVLHNNAYDEIVLDEFGNETDEVMQRFTTSFTTVLANYNFEENPDNIFAILRSEIDKNGADTGEIKKAIQAVL